ncbi:hypothetical protein INT47_007077 [Mucor saturninus]|uniref:Reverse transcriptase RNase H-like domain-containing protein n=1 Tax=Mucor saturninus TaxID=64648 RepID=A0A8H7UTW5_9FUNG|nr:hypothetical protein INT47_007077 [Mucor saturninus]
MDWRQTKTENKVGRRALLNEEHKKPLEETFFDHPSATLDQPIESLTSQFSKLKVTERTVNKYMTEKFALSFKTHLHSKERNSPIQTDMNYNSNCVFIDGAAFHINLKREKLLEAETLSIRITEKPINFRPIDPMTTRFHLNPKANTYSKRCPLVLISETLDRLHSGKILKKSDMRDAYNLLRLAPGHEWKTASRTRYGEFQYQFIPFFVVSLDDILIYSVNPQEHINHLRLVLQKHKAARVSRELEECKFEVPSVQCQYQVPLRYQGSRIINNLKAAITSNAVLGHFNPKVSYLIETDSSDFALGAGRSQLSEDSPYYPITFNSRKLLSAKLNYQIYDKKVLAIAVAFKHWRRYLEFSTETTILLPDHKKLEYFANTRNLSRSQVRWAEILKDFNYRNLYRPAKKKKRCC